MADIGAKIKIDGAKQFRDDLKNLTQAGKTLSAQMGTLASSFDKADDKENVLAKATDNLSAQIKNQQKIFDKLNEAVQKSAKEKGEDATETLKLKEQLAKAETALNKMKGTTAESAVGMNKLGGEERTVAKEAKNASGKISAMTVALGNLAADAIKGGIKAIGNGVKKIAKYFVDATKGAADFADEILTLSSQTHLSTDALQEYKYMASLIDVELSTVTGAQAKLTKSMASGSKAFKKLGVNVRDGKGNLRSANDVFDDAITALGGVANETERDALAMEIFGKSARELNPLIDVGGKQLQKYRKEAHDVGYVLKGDTLVAMGEVQNGFDRIGLAASSLKNRVGVTLGKSVLPYLNGFVSAVQDLLKTGDFTAFGKRIGKMLKTLVTEISKSLPNILKTGAAIAEELFQGIISVLPDLANTAIALLSALAMYLIENLPTIVEVATQILLELANALAEQAPTLIPAIIQCVLTIVDGFIAHISDFIDAGIAIINGIVDGLLSDQGLTSIIDAIPRILTAFFDAMFKEDNFGKILNAGVDLLIALGGALVKAIPELIGYIPEICTSIWDAITGYDWLGLGKEILTKLGDGLVSMGETLLYNIKMAFNKVWIWFSNLGKKAWEWGKDLIKGLVKGIKDSLPELSLSMLSVAKKMSGMVHFSRPDYGPLRDYEKWMPDFMSGLAKGIDDNAWRVQDALKDATGGMTLSGRTTNVDMGGIAVNVYAAPNQDANAIARQVMAVMQNEYNAKKAVFA